MPPTTSLSPDAANIVYPDSDGQPMAENTLQFRWIVTIEGGLDAQYAQDDNVFVAGDLLWYPVEGEPSIRQAPDAMVAFGRPKGRRGSYMQWKEGGIAPQVVFEVMSPGNRYGEMVRKFGFYERHGVEEYYVYDPDDGDLFGWLRSGDGLREIPRMEGWVSPRLGVRFSLENGDLVMVGPNGRRFVSYVVLNAQRQEAERQLQAAEHAKDQAVQQAEALRLQLKALGIEPTS